MKYIIALTLILTAVRIEAGNDEDSGSHLRNRHLAKPEKVDMCHIPPGKPSNAHSISVSVNALKGHEKHEDLEGPCDAPANCRILCNDDDPCTDDSFCTEVNGNPSIQCNPVPVDCSSDGEAIREEFQQRGTIDEFVLDGFAPAFYDIVAEDLQGRSMPSGGIEFDGNTQALHGEYGFPVDSIFSISGNFNPDSMTVAEDTTIRAYTANGFAAQTLVNAEDGFFSMTITNVPFGRTPIVLVVSEPSLNNDGPSRQLSRNLGLLDALKVPCVIYSINNNWCPSDLTLKLSWDGSTSDLDLHVYEDDGSGQHVYYGNMRGDDGELDVDDTYGYGPEHYTTYGLTTPKVFQTKVHMWSYRADGIVNWELEAQRSGEHAWTEFGTFDPDASSNDWSDSFSIAAAPSTCGQCFSDSPGGRRLVASSCCPPKQYTKSFWCFWCKKEVRPAYTFWDNLQDISDPSVAQVKGLARLIFADGDGLVDRDFYTIAMSNVRDNNGCLPIVWDKLLNIFCANDALQESLGGILEGNSAIGLVNLLGSAGTGTKWYELVLEYTQGDLEGNLLEGASSQLKSYTADRGLVSEFTSVANLCVY